MTELTNSDMITAEPYSETSAEQKAEEDRLRLKRRRYRNAAMWSAVLFAGAFLFGLCSPAYRDRGVLTALSDAFMLPGLALTALGLVRMAGYYGSLDIVGYYIMRQASMRSKDHDSLEEREKRRMTLSEYRDRKSLNRVFPTQDFALGIPLTVISLILAMYILK